jgi:asparagine synthetase B (glutamine-hydrolysing)
MSGQGADEILSDYGFGGNKHFRHSEFGGLFPKEQKLWYSFNDGTQIQYLNKEEYTAGHFGIEARYPFLDKQLVQEFLWLTPEVKNRNYKSPLHDYLNSQTFPFDKGKKLGFTPFKR